MEENRKPDAESQAPEAPEVQPVPAESAGYQTPMDAPQVDAPGVDASQAEASHFDEDDDLPARPGRSKKWYIIGGLLVVFLAAAAFLGARLLRPPGAAEGAGGNQIMLSSKGGPGGAKSVRIDMEPAKELPQDEPTTNGVFVRRDDQSLFIGTGNVQMAVRKSNGGGSDISSKYDGPVVEVVTNHQTKIYHDVSEMPEPDKAVDGVVHTQQVVEEGSLDDLGDNMVVTVWGEKQGDRFIANVILYR